MSWNDDERLYQPRVHSSRIRELHRISHEIGEPITVLLDQALGEFIDRYDKSCFEEHQAAFPEGDYLPTDPEP